MTTETLRNLIKYYTNMKEAAEIIEDFCLNREVPRDKVSLSDLYDIVILMGNSDYCELCTDTDIKVQQFPINSELDFTYNAIDYDGSHIIIIVSDELCREAPKSFLQPKENKLATFKHYRYSTMVLDRHEDDDIDFQVPAFMATETTTLGQLKPMISDEAYDNILNDIKRRKTNEQ